jgi:hypothetical protein
VGARFHYSSRGSHFTGWSTTIDAAPARAKARANGSRFVR